MPGIETRYRVIFSIHFQHPIIRGDSNTLLKVMPSVECRVLLADLRWIFKPFPNGCWIIVPTTNNIPLFTIKSLTTFTFDVVAVRPEIFSMTEPFAAKGITRDDAEDIRWVLAGKPQLYLNNIDSNGGLDTKAINGDTQKQQLSRNVNITKEDLGVGVNLKIKREPEKADQPFIELAAVNSDFNNFELWQILPLSPLAKVSEASLVPGKPYISFDLSSKTPGAYELKCSKEAESYSYPVYVEKYNGIRSRLAIVEIFKTAEMIDFESDPIQYHANFQL